ncbi:hypothetical protein M408DRAFT_327177 [Serendipita vermifera MAFF 305830]|uniref:Uncharacterized protein n=1 Tax=Serendipita vermifera MAFF 305830 TaxID=933852 RepID=A0A0C2XS29_SERVB|nr:hypothetical protein M408DRAFT_327177 [Serendipita vermifera MAFF 305830]
MFCWYRNQKFPAKKLLFSSGQPDRTRPQEHSWRKPGLTCGFLNAETHYVHRLRLSFLQRSYKHPPFEVSGQPLAYKVTPNQRTWTKSSKYSLIAVCDGHPPPFIEVSPEVRQKSSGWNHRRPTNGRRSSNNDSRFLLTLHPPRMRTSTKIWPFNGAVSAVPIG